MTLSGGRRQRLFTLWLLFGINALNFFDRQILGAVSEFDPAMAIPSHEDGRAHYR